MPSDLNPDYLPNLRLGEQAPAQVKVTQEDRRKAATIYQHFRDHDYARWIMDGTNAGGDYNGVIQTLASHREAAERRVVEWLRSLNEGGHEGWQPDYLAEMIERGEHIQENSNGE